MCSACKRVRYCRVHARARGLHRRHIHGSELVHAAGLPELRAACKDWLIGQRIIVFADEMCDKVTQELHRCRDSAVSESNPRRRTDITETPEKGQPDDEPDDTSRRFRSIQHSITHSNLRYADMHHPTPRSLSAWCCAGSFRGAARGKGLVSRRKTKTKRKRTSTSTSKSLSTMIRTKTSVAASRPTLPDIVCKINGSRRGRGARGHGRIDASDS